MEWWLSDCLVLPPPEFPLQMFSSSCLYSTDVIPSSEAGPGVMSMVYSKLGEDSEKEHKIQKSFSF